MAAPYRPARWEFAATRLWHAGLLGGFAVAWVTADEDTYALHWFAGWLVVALVALRAVAALVAPAGSPLALVRPNRKRVLTWGIVGALAATGAAGVSGVLADGIAFLEDPHEALSNLALWLALAHVAITVVVIKGRQWLARVRAPAAVALAAILATAPAWAADPARDAIVASYAAQARSADPAFAGFSAARGEALYRSVNTANKDAASCSTCHTVDPTGMGRHVKTGRAIEPVAVSANPKRLTEADKVEERFTRDCKSILGRACTALEKGDYVTFLMSR